MKRCITFAFLLCFAFSGHCQKTIQGDAKEIKNQIGKEVGAETETDYLKDLLNGELFKVSDISWFDFLFLTGIIVLIYMACLWFLILPWSKENLGKNHLFSRIIKYLYWPIAGVILIGTFILVSPWHHGLIMAIIFIFSWKYLKEILTGSFIKLSQLYKLDVKYDYGGKTGKLLSLDMIGGRFKSAKGVQFLTYSQILDSKLFSLIDETSSLDITMICNQASSEMFSIEHIQDMIFDCPYVDHYIKPQIKRIDDNTIQFDISTRTMIKEEKVLQYFSRRDKGINFNISNNYI